MDYPVARQLAAGGGKHDTGIEQLPGGQLAALTAMHMDVIGDRALAQKFIRRPSGSTRLRQSLRRGDCSRVVAETAPDLRQSEQIRPLPGHGTGDQGTGLGDVLRLSAVGDIWTTLIRMLTPRPILGSVWLYSAALTTANGDRPNGRFICASRCAAAANQARQSGVDWRWRYGGAGTKFKNFCSGPELRAAVRRGKDGAAATKPPMPRLNRGHIAIRIRLHRARHRFYEPDKRGAVWFPDKSGRYIRRADRCSSAARCREIAPRPKAMHSRAC